jgi:hypothetical protein
MTYTTKCWKLLDRLNQTFFLKREQQLNGAVDRVK